MNLIGKLLTAIGVTALLGLGAYALTNNTTAQDSDVLIRALQAVWVCTIIVGVMLAVYTAAYVATAKQRRAEAERPGTPGPDGPTYAPDSLDRRPVRPAKFAYNMILIAVVVVFFAAFFGTGMDVRALLDLPSNMWNYGVLMSENMFAFGDEDTRGYWSESFEAMIESVAIAWIGTLVGAVFSLPCGFLAARNMTTLSVYIPMRFILSVIRAVPEIVFAVAIMIPLFGVGDRGGALAGAFALGVSSVGTLSKLISEAIESVDHGPIESARASGATHIQTIRWAVLPQVMPEVIAIWLYRFEVNIRASAILGTLGAGGIGRLLSQVFDRRDWERIGIALIVIVIVTVIVDQISAFIRHRVIHGKKAKHKKARTASASVPDA